LSEDTLFRGMVCGLIAGISKYVIDVILFSLRIINVGYWDFAALVAFNRNPQNLTELISASILELTFCMFWGVVFSLLVSKLKTKHHIPFGVFYGSLIWFFIKAAILAFNITKMMPPDQTTITPLITWGLSMVFGLLLAILNHRFETKTRLRWMNIKNHY
jgi:vacuolar-type H+-ATPase subunit I/STV1